MCSNQGRQRQSYTRKQPGYGDGKNQQKEGESGGAEETGIPQPGCHVYEGKALPPLTVIPIYT